MVSGARRGRPASPGRRCPSQILSLALTDGQLRLDLDVHLRREKPSHLQQRARRWVIVIMTREHRAKLRQLGEVRDGEGHLQQRRETAAFGGCDLLEVREDDLSRPAGVGWPRGGQVALSSTDLPSVRGLVNVRGVAPAELEPASVRCRLPLTRAARAPVRPAALCSRPTWARVSTSLGKTAAQPRSGEHASWGIN
jgi:hypothetical protein